MRLVDASVRERQSEVDFDAFYTRQRTTGECMGEYRRAASPLGCAAVKACLDRAGTLSAVHAIGDLFIICCTRYTAACLDTQRAILLCHATSAGW